MAEIGILPRDEAYRESKREPIEPCTVDLPLLPIDILMLIFQKLPLYPRLCVLSLVCKSWRNVALRSVTAYAASRWHFEHNFNWHYIQPDPCPAIRLMYLFSALRDLTITGSYGYELALSLPMALTRLALLDDFSFPVDYRFTAPLPALLQLVYAPVEYGHIDNVLPVISAGLSTITALTMPFQFTNCSEYFNTAFMPALVDLTLNLYRNRHGPCVLLSSFLPRHASQLTALSLLQLWDPLPAEFISCKFPNLLALQSERLTAQTLANFLLAAPRLRDVIADSSLELSTLPPSHLSLLVQLDVYHLKPADMELLPLCTRLRQLSQSVTRVSTKGYALLNPLYALGIGRFIRVVDIWGYEGNVLCQVFEGCRFMTTLTIFTSSDLAVVPTSATLYHLKEVTVHRHEWTEQKDAFTLARSVAGIAPVLESLTLRRTKLANKSVPEYACLRELLMHLARKGVPHLHVDVEKFCLLPSDLAKEVTEAARGWTKVSLSQVH